MEDTTKVSAEETMDVETELTEDEQLLEQYGVLVSAEYYNFA